MKKGWTVTIEGRAAKALADLDPEEIGERLAEDHAVVTLDPSGLLSTIATVDASSYIEALEYLYEALANEVGRVIVEKAEAVTEDRFTRELEQTNAPDLVGLAEIAELAGTTRQRVFQMTANKGFPSALLELRSGRLWSRPAIEAYLEGRHAALKGKDEEYAAGSRATSRAKASRSAVKAKPEYGRRVRTGRFG